MTNEIEVLNAIAANISDIRESIIIIEIFFLLMSGLFVMKWALDK